MRRILVVQAGPQVPSWDDIVAQRGSVHTVHGVAEAEAELAGLDADVILLQAGQDGSLAARATARLARYAPVVVVGPDELVTTRAVIIAGADEYLAEARLSPDTLWLAIDCADARRIARATREAMQHRLRRRSTEAEQDTLRTGLINHLADRLLNPTTIIRLQASILAKEVRGVDVSRFAQMAAAVERLRATVDQITYAYKAQTGPSALLASPQRLAALHDKAAAAAGVSQCRAQGDAVLEADPVHIEEILEAALRWAVTSVPGVPDVQIRVRGMVACYRVVLPNPIQASQADLFQPFFGLEDPGAGPELGLGLYAARLNARRMGGDVSVRIGPPTVLQIDVPLEPQNGPPTRVVIDATPRRGHWIGRTSSEGTRLLAVSSWRAARRLLASAVPTHIVIGTPADVDAASLTRLLQERYPDAVIEHIADPPNQGGAGTRGGRRPPRPVARQSDRLEAVAAPQRPDGSAVAD